MAKIILHDGKHATDFSAIQKRLAGIGITLNAWPTPANKHAQPLLEQKALNDAQKEELLGFVEGRFETLKRTQGYATRDLIVIHEDIPGLADMLAKFESIHYHTDDEVRYILAGRGYFGFVEPDGGQFMLEVGAGDYINIPAHTEHWFTMRDSKRIKAVRYFIDTSGWTPVYTKREMLFA
ncbi:MAG TPA: cupin domain-containing protein [Acidiferrobacterales bacterium]|nr:cupin domain-containing protein [Acidiferrobacterales bacterium]